ncbi:MAG: bifunctional phosphoribosylaminoimidazolecarboxamide formyltransferase/IMP cyclohydrolase, partial [Planctomycetota bacterium]
PVDLATAKEITSTFVEVVIAPSYTAEALTILTTKPKWKANVRLLAVGTPGPIPAGARYLKNVLGGVLVQDYDTLGWDPAKLQTVTKRAPTAAELADLAFAWPVVKHLSSNAICIIKDRELVGSGAGQMSRVNSTDIAVRLAGARAHGAVAASDAFFPFPDGPQKLIDAGITAIVQPGGSKGDPAVIEACDKAGIAMVFTGVRHFRH